MAGCWLIGKANLPVKIGPGALHHRSCEPNFLKFSPQKKVVSIYSADWKTFRGRAFVTERFGNTITLEELPVGTVASDWIVFHGTPS
jgi:hypothetical protein